MAWHYTFKPEAAIEYEDAFKWYEVKSKIAADNLIIAVQDAILAVCANPFRYQNAYKDLRELSHKKYPFTLIYFIDEKDKLIVISIFHQKLMTCLCWCCARPGEMASPTKCSLWILIPGL
ncbi:MAG: type II toxin-antitoxin system RelE/ParE family toxin [Ginsengibacter sp.]